MLLSYAVVGFYLSYDGATGMQICVLLTRSQCRVSDTQVTISVCGPLDKWLFSMSIDGSRSLIEVKGVSF